MKTKQLVLCALFCALTIIFAQLIIPTTPVQFSLSILPVLLCGFVLSPKYAFFTQLAYILLGAAGLPVLGKFMGGLGALFGPTGGYVLSYPLMALACSFIAGKANTKNIFINFLCQIPSLLICYIAGSAYLAFNMHTSFYAALAAGVFPFILFDIIKLAVCSLAASLLKHHKALAN